ncbi:hypothetical protein, partial [Mesorhizobium sp. M3A.F.Ca.ET.175.01.1.1]|uniref:hypothetical protein n=1 Tax=Mesorhizobium sp. M3A.F.Ca.ET.175.01.1.1 TaxID=2563945 RepID=UPI001AEEFDA3
PGQHSRATGRDVENLDSVDPREFATLCENVSSLRLYYALPDHLRSDLKRNDALSAFSLKNRLGRLSVNDIIERVITEKAPFRSRYTCCHANCDCP